jgi:hypothetical protein
LAERAGVDVPELWVMPEGDANALVCKRGGRPVVAVSRTLLNTFSRTELEGVVAHCIGRLRRSMLPEAVFAALGGRIPGMPAVVGAADDVWAAALTRYPPALAAALAKSGPPGRIPAFWFAADPPAHEARADRIALLEDL